MTHQSFGSRAIPRVSATLVVALCCYDDFIVIQWSERVIQSDERTSSTAGGSTGRDIEHELKRCSLEILRRRELIESLPTFAPLTIAATPLFEVALEITCQVAHSRALCLATADRSLCAGINERCLAAVSRLSGAGLNLPARRSADFLDFWFESDESGGSSERLLEPAPAAFDPGHGDANSQLLADHRPDDVLDAFMSLGTDLLEDSFEEPADVGGDMNITLEFVHIANRVFDDTEALIARVVVQLQSIGRELIELLGQLDRHAGDGTCAER